LIDKVLKKAAAASQMTHEELLAIPQGDKRRKLHDDISIIVILLSKE